MAPDGGVPDTAAEMPDTSVGTEQIKAEPEVEVYYTFKWGGIRPARTHGGQREGNPRGKAKPQGKKGGPRRDQGKVQGRDKGAQKYQARPPKPEKQIDPDNPFAAALMGLKDKT